MENSNTNQIDEMLRLLDIAIAGKQSQYQQEAKQLKDQIITALSSNN